jgi:hypothetical protein
VRPAPNEVDDLEKFLGDASRRGKKTNSDDDFGRGHHFEIEVVVRNPALTIECRDHVKNLIDRFAAQLHRYLL